MGLRIRQLLAVAHNAMADILRAPLFAVIYCAAVLLAGVLPLMPYLSFLEKRQLVADSLLALTFMAGVFAAAAAATSTVGDEIRRRTAVAVLSKPVGRGLFVAGKLAGIGAALAVLWLALAAATLIASRTCFDDYATDRLAAALYFGAVALGILSGALANFLFGKAFGAAAAIACDLLLVLALALLAVLPGWNQRPGWELLDPRLLPALVLCFPAMLLTAGVATILALRLEPTPTLLITLLVFGVGLLSDYLVGRHAAHSVAAAVVHRLWPNWQPFWVADVLAAEKLVPWSYVAGASGYAVVYLVGLWLVATAVCERRPVG